MPDTEKLLILPGPGGTDGPQACSQDSIIAESLKFIANTEGPLPQALGGSRRDGKSSCRTFQGPRKQELDFRDKEAAKGALAKG